MKIYKKDIFVRLLLIKIVLLSLALISYFGYPLIKDNTIFAKKNTSLKTVNQKINEKSEESASIQKKEETSNYLGDILSPPKLDLEDTNEKIQEYLNRAQATQKQLKIRMQLLDKKIRSLAKP